jgi:hypothetical protein
MSPAEMHEGEVRYYSSPIMVKTQQYMGTISSERLIIESGTTIREFKIANIVDADPITLPNNEPGLKIVLSTTNGHKEMIWSFPVRDVFKAGEQHAWADLIKKVVGNNHFAVSTSQSTPTRVASMTTVPPQFPAYSQDEMEILKTAGVRVKHTYYSLYLTNFRLILQNASGKIGREFVITELMDVSKMESESGEPAIALTIGTQTDVKQMVLTFPSFGSREVWMVRLSANLSMHAMPPLTAQAPQMFTLQPGEKTYMSSPGTRVKRASFTAYLTNTRFVLMGSTNGTFAIVGEFAVNTLKKVVRIAGEFGEPGACLTIASREGKKNMHMFFPSMDLREMWIAKFEEIISPEQPQIFGSTVSAQYSVTTVTPQSRGSVQVKHCTVCGTRNHPDDRFCAMCGKSLGETGTVNATAVGEAMPESLVSDMFGGDGNVLKQRKERTKREKRLRHDNENDLASGWSTKKRRELPPKHKRALKRSNEKKQYNGGVVTFLTRTVNVFGGYNSDNPCDAVGSFLITGIIWAVISVVMLAYALPIILPITTADFPIIGALQGNVLAMIVLTVVMLVLLIVLVVIQGVLSGIFAKIFGEDVSISETTIILIQSTLPYAIVGWVPGFGILIAGFWSLVSTIKKFNNDFDMHNGVVAGCSIFSLATIAIVIVVLDVV